MSTRTPISRPIMLLGLVSLLTDMASELLYPVAPLYLTGPLGASLVVVGLLEGIAEGMGGFLKGYFGALSDRLGTRAPFVRAGYTMSALSKPLPGLWPSAGVVVVGRLADRLGKGLRSAPRDALLAGYAPAGAQGRVFGFHRAMDTAGAVLGPLLAIAFLTWRPGDYTTLFLLAFLPGVLAVLCVWRVRDAPFPATPGRRFAPFAVFAYWRSAPRPYRQLVAALTLFGLVNSSDVFLILKAKQVGFSDTAAIGGYVLYNGVYALAAYPAGNLADRLGKRQVIVLGLGWYAVVYAGFALLTETWQAWLCFALYGLYAAATEGVSKAWIADLVPPEQRGSAIGLQTMLASFSVLVASSSAGLLWEHVAPAAPFWLAAGGAGLAALWLGIVPPGARVELSGPDDLSGRGDV
ncbi:MFS transporter [Chloracidobacterium sp. MS 40/45]|uniref:MFS transporter n=1 Tax=Chloracidobacterium aggregatum TaxID=2851959 RepID=UPI001B8C15C2|nr:MFS transporter [Chloracidobacterium aggregatum]QUW00827.1 MFS transporter [Chloracidobacterium sp. MS 40/45]